MGEYKRPEEGKNLLEEHSPAWIVSKNSFSPGLSFQMIERIRAGLKKADWKQLLKYIDGTEKEFESVLPSSISSMQKKSIYDSETSERIYELARLYGMGYEVFDSKADFKEWLHSPSRALGDRCPFDFLDSSFGFQLVEDQIQRIQYNVYS